MRRVLHTALRSAIVAGRPDGRERLAAHLIGLRAVGLRRDAREARAEARSLRSLPRMISQ